MSCWASCLQRHCRFSIRSTRAFAESIGRVLILPWFAFVGALGIWCAFSGLGDVPDPGWLVCLWFVIGYLTDFAFCLWGFHKLSQDLRLAAAQQFAPRRSRVLNWLLTKAKAGHASSDDPWQ